jgi:membrane protease YdiL (CAAX protease family)
MATEKRSLRAQLGELPRVAVLTLALSLLALPAVAFAVRLLELNVSPVEEVAIRWAVALAVVGLTTRVERRSQAALGLRRPTAVDAVYLLGTTVATLFVFVATDPLVAALGLATRDGAGAMSADTTLAVGLLGAVTTGVVEELLYRGYPIERLLDATERPLVAGGLTWGVFTLAHATYWPLGNLVQVAAVAAVLTAVYLRRRTLVPVVGAHVLVWTLAVLGQVYG